MGIYPLLYEVQVAEDQSHIDEENYEANEEKGDVGVHHVVNLIVVTAINKTIFDRNISTLLKKNFSTKLDATKCTGIISLYLEVFM
jgi:hypothetical protein